MSRRIKVTLEDEQYDRLLVESVRSGFDVAEIIRRALDEVYGSSTVAGRKERLESSFGAWPSVEGDPVDDRASSLDGLDGAAYVRRLRHGLGVRPVR